MRLSLRTRLAVIGWLARDLEVVEEDAPYVPQDPPPPAALVVPEERADVVEKRSQIVLEYPADFYYDMTDAKIRYMVLAGHRPAELFFISGARLSPMCVDCGQKWPCMAQQALNDFYKLHPDIHAEETST